MKAQMQPAVRISTRRYMYDSRLATRRRAHNGAQLPRLTSAWRRAVARLVEASCSRQCGGRLASLPGQSRAASKIHEKASPETQVKLPNLRHLGDAHRTLTDEAGGFDRCCAFVILVSGAYLTGNARSPIWAIASLMLSP